LLHQPSSATSADEVLLRDIVHEYPYFQTARVVLTKYLHQQHSYLFEKELKITALHAGSRSRLYHYIHLQSPPEEATIEELPEVSVSSSDDEATFNFTEETAVPDTAVPVEIEPAVVSELQPETTAEHAEHSAEFTLESPVDELPADSTSIGPDLASPHSFDEWLNLLSEQRLPEVKHSQVSPEEHQTSDTAEPEIAPPAVLSVPKDNNIEQTQTPAAQSFDADRIIERFIADSPSISRPKAEFFNPVNMAKMSVEEDEDLVTETLARINAKQGNYKKAIRMYEKLCLKFPEKMPYFVDLIQKIKTEHKLD
jgi:hypothetical protein